MYQHLMSLTRHLEAKDERNDEDKADLNVYSSLPRIRTQLSVYSGQSCLDTFTLQQDVIHSLRLQMQQAQSASVQSRLLLALQRGREGALPEVDVALGTVTLVTVIHASSTAHAFESYGMVKMECINEERRITNMLKVVWQSGYNLFVHRMRDESCEVMRELNKRKLQANIPLPANPWNICCNGMRLMMTQTACTHATFPNATSNLTHRPTNRPPAVSAVHQTAHHRSPLIQSGTCGHREREDGVTESCQRERERQRAGATDRVLNLYSSFEIINLNLKQDILISGVKGFIQAMSTQTQENRESEISHCCKINLYHKRERKKYRINYKKKSSSSGKPNSKEVLQDIADQTQQNGVVILKLIIKLMGVRLRRRTLLLTLILGVTALRTEGQKQTQGQSTVVFVRQQWWKAPSYSFNLNKSLRTERMPQALKDLLNGEGIPDILQPACLPVCLERGDNVSVKHRVLQQLPVWFLQISFPEAARLPHKPLRLIDPLLKFFASLFRSEGFDLRFGISDFREMVSYPLGGKFGCLKMARGKTREGRGRDGRGKLGQHMVSFPIILKECFITYSAVIHIFSSSHHALQALRDDWNDSSFHLSKTSVHLTQFNRPPLIHVLKCKKEEYLCYYNSASLSARFKHKAAQILKPHILADSDGQETRRISRRDGKRKLANMSLAQDESRGHCHFLGSNKLLSHKLFNEQKSFGFQKSAHAQCASKSLCQKLQHNEERSRSTKQIISLTPRTAPERHQSRAQD
ncbi:hypothetical protein DNTS_003255 [Danionella cerebrum]|uniref:Uncharacterized protein n=1 Tax=Danionella cerebrum TaxID=2873325 RepID=A0A553MVE2_9TELE|nr:hypothetical protein DNTS_003255 [Danionella translucida]